MKNKLLFAFLRLFIKEKNNGVLFVWNESNNNLERNISHFLYTKNFLSPQETSTIKKIKLILKSKYIFVEEHFDLLKYSKGKVCILSEPTLVNYLTKDSLTIELENEVFKKYKYITASSDKVIANYKATYGWNENQEFLPIGSIFFDKFYNPKYLEEVDKVFENTLITLTSFNVLYKPLIKNDIDKRRCIDNLTYLSENLPGNYQLFHCLDNEINNPNNNINYIEPSEEQYFYKIANIIVTDYDSIIFKASIVNSNILLFRQEGLNIETNISDNELNLPIIKTKNNLVEEIIDFKNNDNELFQYWNQYNKGTTSRELVIKIFGKFKEDDG